MSQNEKKIKIKNCNKGMTKIPERLNALTDHCNSVIEQRLSKHPDKKHFVHMHLLEHSDHSHWIYSSKQAAEEQKL